MYPASALTPATTPAALFPSATSGNHPDLLDGMLKLQINLQRSSVLTSVPRIRIRRRKFRCRDEEKKSKSERKRERAARTEQREKFSRSGDSISIAETHKRNQLSVSKTTRCCTLRGLAKSDVRIQVESRTIMRPRVSQRGKQSSCKAIETDK